MPDKRIKLELTCGACPEQYNVYIDGEKLGYLRLRHGEFRAEYRDEIVFEGHPNGEGCFEKGERVLWLNRACCAILKSHEAMNEPIYEIDCEGGFADDD